MPAAVKQVRANADLNFTVSSWHQFGTLKNETEIVCVAGFGKVLKVLDKRTQKHYAMKLQPKDSWTFQGTNSPNRWVVGVWALLVSCGSMLAERSAGHDWS